MQSTNGSSLGCFGACVGICFCERMTGLKLNTNPDEAALLGLSFTHELDETKCCMYLLITQQLCEM